MGLLPECNFLNDDVLVIEQEDLTERFRGELIENIIPGIPVLGDELYIKYMRCDTFILLYRMTGQYRVLRSRGRLFDQDAIYYMNPYE